jgi:hypothetical protein
MREEQAVGAGERRVLSRRWRTLKTSCEFVRKSCAMCRDCADGRGGGAGSLSAGLHMVVRPKKQSSMSKERREEEELARKRAAVAQLDASGHLHCIPPCTAPKGIKRLMLRAFRPPCRPYMPP